MESVWVNEDRSYYPCFFAPFFFLPVFPKYHLSTSEHLKVSPAYTSLALHCNGTKSWTLLASTDTPVVVLLCRPRRCPSSFHRSKSHSCSCMWFLRSTNWLEGEFRGLSTSFACQRLEFEPWFIRILRAPPGGIPKWVGSRSWESTKCDTTLQKRSTNSHTSVGFKKNKGLYGNNVQRQ